MYYKHIVKKYLKPHCCYLILDATLSNHRNANKGEIKGRIQSLLRYAPDREGGARRKKKQNEPSGKKLSFIDENDEDDDVGEPLDEEY